VPAFIGGVAIAVSIFCTSLLLFWMFQVFRGESPLLGRVATSAVAVSLAIWQVYLLFPTIGIYMAYVLLPVVVMSFISALFRNVKDVLKQSPSGGPSVKTPAMAKRLPGEPGTPYEEEEKRQRRTA